MDFIINEKGTEVISERHQKDFKKEDGDDNEPQTEKSSTGTSSFTDVSFDDI